MERITEKESSASLIALNDSASIQAMGKLLDRTFPVKEKSHFFDDFPVWAAQNENIQRWGIVHNSEVVASAALRMAALRTHFDPIPVGIVGAVAADPRHRGKGYASKLVEHALAAASHRAAAAVFLWGSEHELYRRLGFELCGLQIRTRLEQLELSEKKTCFNEGWNPRLWPLVKKRTQGLELDDADRAWWLKHGNVKWFWSGTIEKPDAYAALGRGIDLKNMIHEWGGEPEAVLTLLKALAHRFPQAQILGTPGLFAQYNIPIIKDSLEYLCMARVLNPSALIRGYYPNEKVPLQEINAASDTQRVKLLFGPDAEEDYPSDSLPLPLWLWGLDSA